MSFNTTPPDDVRLTVEPLVLVSGTACQTKMRDSKPCGCADYAKHLFYAKYIYCLTLFIIVLWVAIITVQITDVYKRQTVYGSSTIGGKKSSVWTTAVSSEILYTAASSQLSYPISRLLSFSPLGSFAIT